MVENSNIHQPQAHAMTGASESTHIDDAHRNPLADIDIDLRALLAMFWRRKFVIVFSMALAVFAATFFANSIQPRYEARSVIMVETQRAKTDNYELLLTNTGLDSALMFSEVEVILSRNLLHSVVTQLNLIYDPEFGYRVAKNKNEFKWTDLRDWIDLFTKKEFILETPESRAVRLSLIQEMVAEQREYVIQRTIDRLRSNLQVKPIAGTFAIEVVMRAYDPVRAANISNMVASLYIDQRLQKKFNASDKLNEWLDKRLGSLRAQVRRSEAAVEQYKGENDLFEGVRAEITVQRISELSSQVLNARSALAEAQARAEQIDDLMQTEGGLDTIHEIVVSNLMERLKTLEASLIRSVSEMSSRYGDKHPILVNARKELKDVRKKIQTEKENIAGSIVNEVRIAEVRLRSLEAALKRIESQRKRENKATIRLRELQSEALANRQLYETIQSSYKQNDQRDALQDAEATIITNAVPPLYPTYPNKPLIISLAASMGFIFGVALSFILEKLDNVFRTQEQLENLTEYPCFGQVPYVYGEDEDDEPLADHVIEHPSGVVAETLRFIWTAISLKGSYMRFTPKVVMITSSLPGEGKSMLSAWLTRIVARSGKKVMLIDCDLRQPQLHKVLHGDQKGTLADFLLDQKGMEEVLHKDEKSGAHVIYSASVPSQALDLVSSAKMQSMINGMRDHYDLIILDAPASLAVADARMLASYADFSLYIVRWADTTRDLVQSGIRQFADLGYTKLATVFTQVDLRRYGHMSYSSSKEVEAKYANSYFDDKLENKLDSF